ncbi:hypothetical protein EI94DRAFT_1802865 [Lactarius quietus]|nr:hypothetical protein EI94DRAFT_1802865 [Lactarius quietus]
MSTTAGGEDEPDVDVLADNDDDDDDVYPSPSQVSGKCPSRPSSMSAPSSNWTVATPSSLSQPSGLPAVAIAGLTHDELCLNVEFLKYINLVDVLLKMWEQPPAHSPSPAGLSLCLSDLASQASSRGYKPTLPLPFPHPSVRPSHYPPTVLWLFDDCKTDPSVHLSAGNKSRPPMQDIIQHKDGQVITVDKWKLIRQSAVVIAHAHLDVLSTSHLPPSAASLPRKIVFYRCHFLKEWLQAVRALEVLAPLLSLCGGTWKAEKALASVLQDKPLQPPSHAPHTSTPALSSSHSHASTLAFPSSHSRAHSAHSAPSHPHSAHSCASTPGIPPSSVVSGRSSSNIPTSAASSAHSTWVSPRRAALKSTIQAWPVLGPSQPAAASKAVAPKAKHRCEPSPPQNEKRAKGSNEPTPEVPSSSPCPAFLSLVQEGVASSSQANAVPTVDCAKPLPPKTPRAKALRKGASTHRAMAKTHVAPSDTDTDAVPLASKDLASKKDIIKAIMQVPQSEQPSQEELEALINKRKSKCNAKAA